MTYQQFLKSVDDGHSMTTAKEHIAEICKVASRINNGFIVELGSHAGISAAAIAMASPTSSVVSVDLCDTVRESTRVAYWKSLGVANILPVESSSADYLAAMRGRVDLIFHDAAHGEHVVPEYLAAASRCDVLAIHDWEQVSPRSQRTVSERFASWWCPRDDARGRRLWIGMGSVA